VPARSGEGGKRLGAKVKRPLGGNTGTKKDELRENGGCREPGIREGGGHVLGGRTTVALEAKRVGLSALGRSTKEDDLVHETPKSRVSTQLSEPQVGKRGKVQAMVRRTNVFL